MLVLWGFSCPAWFSGISGSEDHRLGSGDLSTGLLLFSIPPESLGQTRLYEDLLQRPPRVSDPPTNAQDGQGSSREDPGKLM